MERDCLACPCVAAEIQESFIDRDLLDQRRGFAQELHDLLGYAIVDPVSRRDDQKIWAEAQRHCSRHRRPDPELPCGVGCRGNDAPPLRISAHHEWAILQVGVQVRLDRAVEGIQINMQNGAIHTHFGN